MFAQVSGLEVGTLTHNIGDCHIYDRHIPIIEKLLKSAISNAENNHNMAHDKLYIADIYANQGPTLKRIRPAAKGSAVRIRKRTSHVTIVLKERN